MGKTFWGDYALAETCLDSNNYLGHGRGNGEIYISQGKDTMKNYNKPTGLFEILIFV